MAASAPERVGLFSIRPCYADAILDGTKRVEFRKVAPAPDIKVALIYATAPVMKVVGYFEIDEIVRDTPAALWQRFGSVGGIGKDAYDSYYADTRQGCGVALRRAHALTGPVPLSCVRAGLRPPQSFQYLDGEAAVAAGRLIERPDQPALAAGLVHDLLHRAMTPVRRLSRLV